MLFNSLSFFWFFSALLLVSFLASPKAIKSILLLGSLIFYGYWYPPYLLVFVLSVVVDFWCCNRIAESKNPKIYATLSVILHLLLLFSFKYLNFVCGIFGYVLPENFHWSLPLGISFFTFQTIACTVDIYRGQEKAKKNFWDFLLFFCFFPHLIAGPILRLKESWDQVINPQKPTIKSFNYGIFLIFWGLMKKILIADNLGVFVDKVFSGLASENNSLVILLAVYAFAVQIYCDFSGYVDAALGISKIFGIELPINFNFPYLSRSVTEFWRRWHITLSTWFRDYLYIPLGGNRQGEIRTYLNLMVTMLFAGLWHGASWTFVIWGGLYGLYLSFEKFSVKYFGLDLEKKNIFAQIFTFHLVCFAWIFFRARTLGEAQIIIQKLFSTDYLPEFLAQIEAQGVILLIALASVFHLANYRFDLKNKIFTWRVEFRLLYIILAIILIMLFGVKQEVRFIYFDF